MTLDLCTQFKYVYVDVTYLSLGSKIWWSIKKLGSKLVGKVTGGGNGGIFSWRNSNPVPDLNIKRRDAALVFLCRWEKWFFLIAYLRNIVNKCDHCHRKYVPILIQSSVHWTFHNKQFRQMVNKNCAHPRRHRVGLWWTKMDV